MNWTYANVTQLRCLLKLADRVDNSQDGDDDDDGVFEDCEIDSDDAGDKHQVIDMD